MSRTSHEDLRRARDAVDPDRTLPVRLWSEAKVPVKNTFTCVFHPVLGLLPFVDEEVLDLARACPDCEEKGEAGKRKR